MPQVDHEALVWGGGGRVSYETQIDGEAPAETHPAAAEEDPGLPPESYRLQIGDEIGWVDVNAVYDRDLSTKGNTNPKSQHANQKPIPSSQRWSGNLKSKAPIIGLPNKIEHSGYLDHSARRPANGRIFPKGDGRKSAVPADPGSPKVSCFGKVLTERERDRIRRRSRESPAAEEWDGCWASLAAFFRCGGGERVTVPEGVEQESSAPAPSRKLPPPWEAEPAMSAPGLGGMKRFVSGRRTASWGGDVEVEAETEGHVAWSEPLDREHRWGR